MTRHRMRERRKKHQELQAFRALIRRYHDEAQFLNAVHDGATVVVAPGPVADALIAGGTPNHRLNVSRYAPPGYLFAIDPRPGDLVEREPILRIWPRTP